MTVDASVKRILSEAEVGLAQVLHSLASAEPAELASSERRLTDLVGTFYRLEHTARRQPSLPIRGSVLAIRTMLGQSGKLSAVALRSIARQMESRGLFPTGPSATLCVEG